MTTKVYGLRKAMRTMAFMCELCPKRCDYPSFGHRSPTAPCWWGMQWHPSCKPVVGVEMQQDYAVRPASRNYW